MTGNRLFGLGIGAAILAIVVLGWLLGISPMLAQADAAALEIQSVQAQNVVQQTSLAALKAQFGKLPALKKELAILQQAIPESPNLDDFLDELQSVAQSTGVTIAAFTAAEASAYGGATPSAPATPATTPPAPTDGATAAPTDGATAAPAQGATASGNLAGKLFTIPITIGVTGPSENIMAFVNACQLDKRFFLITSAAYTSAGGTISGFVFVLRDPSALLLESSKPKPTATTPTPTPTPSATPTPTPTPSATPEPDSTEEPTG